MCVELSWDGGVSWTTPLATPTLTTSMASRTLGGAANSWGRGWTPADLSNANLRVRVTNAANSTARDFTLDWIAVQGDVSGWLVTTAATTTPGRHDAAIGVDYQPQRRRDGQRHHDDLGDCLRQRRRHARRVLRRRRAAVERHLLTVFSVVEHDRCDLSTGTSITLSATNGRDAIWSGACSSGGNKAKTCTFTLNRGDGEHSIAIARPQINAATD